MLIQQIQPVNAGPQSRPCSTCWDAPLLENECSLEDLATANVMRRCSTSCARAWPNIWRSSGMMDTKKKMALREDLTVACTFINLLCLRTGKKYLSVISDCIHHCKHDFGPCMKTLPVLKDCELCGVRNQLVNSQHRNRDNSTGRRSLQEGVVIAPLFNTAQSASEVFEIGRCEQIVLFLPSSVLEEKYLCWKGWWLGTRLMLSDNSHFQKLCKSVLSVLHDK